jgi:hypothetical protein
VYATVVLLRVSAHILGVSLGCVLSVFYPTRPSLVASHSVTYTGNLLVGITYWDP